MLGARHEGSSLFPVTEWPVAVYICRLRDVDEPTSDEIASENLAVLDWGEARESP